MEVKNVQQRDGFSSRMGIIAAAAGSAIGLGNIWKFPYITGQNGGAAFILVYLICIAIIGLPVMLSEFTIGRRGQRNAIGSFKELGSGSYWFLTGWMGVIASFVILAFYGVVAGWTLNYVGFAITHKLAGLSPDEIGTVFSSFITHPWKPIIYQLIFMVLTAGIVLGGVKDGIEKYSKVLMPLLLLIIVILVIRSVTLPNAAKGIEFLLAPDFSKLNGNVVLSALGHAFFSLSLGTGTMITYGSYIGRKENLATTAVQVTIADTLIALLAGFAIFPAVFAFGIEPGAGPGLVFITLPNVFNQMPGGYFFGLLFFMLLSVAALTSSISVLEVVVAYFSEDLNISRTKATIIATVAISILGIGCSLSMGPWAGFHLPTLDGGKGLFDFLDWWSANILLPLGGLLISLFVGWKMNTIDVQNEVSSNGSTSIPWFGFFLITARIIAPIAVTIVFLYNLGILKF